MEGRGKARGGRGVVEMEWKGGDKKRERKKEKTKLQ